MHSPRLSIVVVSYNIERELTRTLYTLSPSYQRDIAREDYQVIVIDNGSRKPPATEDFAELGIDLEIIYADNPSCSPSSAVNQGIKLARGEWIGVWIDGTRMASPRLLATSLEALRISPYAVVGSKGRYLGPGFQSDTMRRGYDRAVEDSMLEKCEWQADGYRLFDHSVFDESSGPTWFSKMSESNALFMSRCMWDRIGGYDARFSSPGGGLVNLDTWQRAITLTNAVPIVLLGEATFHQFHDGTMTNAKDKNAKWKALCAEYAAIRGVEWQWPNVKYQHWGGFPSKPKRHEMASRITSEGYASGFLGRLRDTLSKCL